MGQTDWSDSWREAFRIELRAEAIGMASRGWPVLAGSYAARSGWVGADTEAPSGPAPIRADWRERRRNTAGEVAALWDGHPYSLLVATGAVVDAVEVDDQLGRATATVLRTAGAPVPIVATPTGRWLFLAKSGQWRADVSDHPEVTVHGSDSWVPLPPTPYLHGIAHWRVKPEVCGWRLPAVDVVQDAVVRALARTHTSVATSWRQVALAGA